MPHGQNPDFVREGNVVDVIARALEQNPARTWDRGMPIETTDVGRVGDDVERRGQFVAKQTW